MDLRDLYEQHFDFVWRSLRRLGVPDGQVEDGAQEVFLVALRRGDEFEGRSSLKTWLFGIALRVARDLRREHQRRAQEPLDESRIAAERGEPSRGTENREALRLLHRLLDELADEQREVFVLAELEQMTAPDISEALGVNLNTVYTRLRAARRDFDAAFGRHQARLEGDRQRRRAR